MCIFSVIYRVIPDCPVFVLTNRDESTERPSLAPHASTLENHTRWFGGSDARAGGTWFGINEHGLVAAITNRKKENVSANPRSRGLLCRDALGHETAKNAVDWVLGTLSQHEYAGFNLVLVSSAEAWVVEAADSTAATRLDPGIHSVSNGPFHSSDNPRVKLAQSLVRRMIDEEPDWRAFVPRAEQICAVHATDNAPGMCLDGENWGTVGSTIAALAANRADAQYHYAPGAPCRTPYTDYSETLRQISAVERP
jgi:uncharacterized protein with NRDE domain